jgi:radical SAM superfamily enzyme YgiQ (UPF0313 family)
VSRGYKFLFLGDDNFLLNKKRAASIMDKIIEEGVNIKMILQGRVDSADYELYKKLREAGVIMIMFGIESVNQDVLNYYNKKVTVNQIKKAVKMANDVGIISLGYFIIGSPLETEKHFQKTKEFFDKYPLDVMLNGILFYVKGAKLWDDAHKKGLIKDDEFMVLSGKKFSNYTTRELFLKREELNKHFYSNIKRIFRIHYKLVRLGLMGFILKALMKGVYKNFFNFVISPYEPAQRM